MEDTDREDSALHSLALQYGIQLSYTDVSGRRRNASRESILRTLAALGAPVSGMNDLAAALCHAKKTVIERGIEPVVVARDGKITGLRLFMNQNSGDSPMHMRLELESGENLTWTHKPSGCRPVHYEKLDRLSYVAREIPVPHILPLGYHALTIERNGSSFAAKIIAAPEKISTESWRTWGIFMPLYSLHSRTSFGAGDFGDLAKLYGWLEKLGGGIIGTLPFLAAFLDDPCEPSPYSPASRLFWNEFYLEIEKIPELERSIEARVLLESLMPIIEEQRSAHLVDYKKQMEVKRKVLEELARCFFDGGSADRASFEKYLAENPLAEDYARFRALGEHVGKQWSQWPARQRDGVILPGDFDEEVRNYHLYVQWRTDCEIGELSEQAEKSGPGLYLDMPLGIHPYSYDAWRFREVFPEGVSGGAPPDVVFPGGQNWGFPPLHPEKIRSDGYRYVIDYVGKMMRHAGVVRIDHVPGLHRLYWIPDGLAASRGVYVRYRADEMYAILSLEAHRNRCMVVGENLGTVPEYVNDAMGRHNVFKMYVAQYELDGDDPEGLNTIPANTVASLNTHDMPPFAGYMEGSDIDDRLEAGLLKVEKAPEERERRAGARQTLKAFLVNKGFLEEDDSPGTLMRAALKYLAAGRDKLLLVNLEDLWMETRSQNLPGTSGDRPNWKRRARYSLEEFSEMPEVVDVLKEINSIRKMPRKRK